ncbi:MAG: T-complex protein 1 subunit delta, partial [archaeon]|nr:T-complex protein 1 subunit delta [archaeon]
PAARMLAELSKAQDVAAGDGTTSVVVIAGALLSATQNLMERGIHPTTISDAYQKACVHALGVLKAMAIPVDLSDRDSLIQSATTALSSKVVSADSQLLAPMAVDAVLGLLKPTTSGSSTSTGSSTTTETAPRNINLGDIRLVKNLGGTVHDSELINGLVFTQKVSHAAGAPTKITNAKIALLQFQLSPPKPNIDHNVVISDYTQMDRVFKEERKYILNLVRVIKNSGANVLLIQKSILRDAINDLALHYLAKLKIMVVLDIERNDIEFISKTLNCQPIASIEGVSPHKLGSAKLVVEESTTSGKIVKITGVPNPGVTMSILIRGSNQLTLDEADRSLHDALCVVRSIVQCQYLLPGGSAPEVEMSMQLSRYAKTLSGKESYCVQAYANALEVIPSTLAENAGLNPISIVTELRNKHSVGETSAGINVRKVFFFSLLPCFSRFIYLFLILLLYCLKKKKGTITSMIEENVLQPLLVTSSALSLATETVSMILKIDDIIFVAR